MSAALVLVVDDEPQILRALQTNLRGAGYEVATAATAEQALSTAAMRSPDAVILDLVLPDGSGIDVCREIRSALPDTYCLILTSYDDQDAVLSSVLAGASGYVLKEVRTSGLVDAIRRQPSGKVGHGGDDTLARAWRSSPPGLWTRRCGSRPSAPTRCRFRAAPT